MKNIIILMGLPRSGKTTLRKLITEKYCNYVTVSADELRYIVYGQRYLQRGEPLVWAIRGYMLESLFYNGNNILIDETNTTVERRKSIIKQAAKYDYKIIGIYVDTKFNVCIQRADSEIMNTLYKMDAQFEIPSLSEGFNAIHEVINNDYSEVLNELAN